MGATLKLFTGFSRDMAADFTGLSAGEIDWLRKQGIVTPKKSAGAFLYTFTDILVLRLVRLLKLNHVPVKNIRKAKEYLSSIDPSKSLTNTTLYIGDKTGKIYYIGEKPQSQVMIELTAHGQLILGEFIVALRVGKDLELVYKDVLGLDKKLSTRLKRPEYVPAEEVYRKYGLA